MPSAERPEARRQQFFVPLEPKMHEAGRSDSSVLRQCRSRFRMSYGEVPQGISFRAVTDAAVRQTWRNMSLACWCSSSRVGYLRASAMSSAS